MPTSCYIIIAHTPDDWNEPPLVLDSFGYLKVEDLQATIQEYAEAHFVGIPENFVEDALENGEFVLGEVAYYIQRILVGTLDAPTPPVLQ